MNSTLSTSGPLWGEVEAMLRAAAPGVSSWSESLTPPFPSEWPPTPKSTWARYRMATGRDPAVADGVLIAAPRRREVLDPTGKVMRSEALPGAGTVLGVQGSGPAGDPPSEAPSRESEEVLFRRAFALRGQPPAGSKLAVELRAFYGSWLRRNDVLAENLRPAHRPFFTWAQK